MKKYRIVMTIINTCFMLLLWCCYSPTKTNSFLDQYEFENFSQFKGTQMFYRGTSENGEILIAFFAPSKQNNFDETCFFNAFVNDSNNINIVCNKDKIYYDTTYIIFLINKFIDYKISELIVDTIGNIMIKPELDGEIIMRFSNKNEQLKRNKEMKWVRIKENWYKPKYYYNIP